MNLESNGNTNDTFSKFLDLCLDKTGFIHEVINSLERDKLLMQCQFREWVLKRKHL